MPGRMMGRPIEPPIDGATVSKVLSISTSVNGHVPESECGHNGQWVRYDAAIPERRIATGAKRLPVIGGVGPGTSQTAPRRTT